MTMTPQQLDALIESAYRMLYKKSKNKEKAEQELSKLLKTGNITQLLTTLL